jgi:hypothetical protein
VPCKNSKKKFWNSFVSSLRAWCSVRAWDDLLGDGTISKAIQMNHLDRNYNKYLFLLGPPRDIYIRLSEHHDGKKTYTPGVKHAGAREYRKRMINTIAPYWKCGSGGDFHECVANVIGAHHRQKADKENKKSHAKGESYKYDRNVVPNDFVVALVMPFTDPNISQGKVNVTMNRGPGACPVFENHETRSQNRRRKEEEEEKKRAAAAPQDKNFSTQEKEGRELIAANKTRRAPVLLDANKKKKKKRKSRDQVLFETEKRVNIEEQKQKVLTARWSVIVQASTIPGVDAASYAGNYLKKYYKDLLDEVPTAPEARGKKKGGKKGNLSAMDLTIDDDTDSSSSDESASGGSDTDSSDDE